MTKTFADLNANAASELLQHKRAHWGRPNGQQCGRQGVCKHRLHEFYPPFDRVAEICILLCKVNRAVWQTTVITIKQQSYHQNPYRVITPTVNITNKNADGLTGHVLKDLKCTIILFACGLWPAREGNKDKSRESWRKHTESTSADSRKRGSDSIATGLTGY